ncbi:MAG: polysaccharide biosynthesis C-terminal domain-containing protein [Acidobacteria bacterium]|nr:polysaccharide biosynthesis C-terminal domain-containing protein [Acidobacteriota bacterium]
MFQKIKGLFVNLAIYGLGDVITSIASFLLLPLYVRFLSATDYGVISLLLTVEVVAKIIFRWGVDASFMRLYYDCPDRRAKQRLASTLCVFLFALNGVCLAMALAAAPLIADRLFGVPGYTGVLRLTLVNTFVIGFYFIPFHVLRITDQPRLFVSLTFSRSAATLIARVILVAFARLGIVGIVLADIIVSVMFTFVLARWFVPLLRPMFSPGMLREALRFGLPRVPHGVAQQVTAVADRYLLSLFVSLREVGLYSIGASFGLALKLFLSAFEYAWAPFYFATMREKDAARTFGAVTTYGLAALILLATGLSAVATDIVRLMTTPAFFRAAEVIPWIALGVLLQGVYLLTSIGLNITKHTEYYPVATLFAAVTSVGANLILIPRYGVLGAAWANVLAYGVLAATAFRFSQKFYRIRYERARIARLIVAGLASYAVASVAVPSSVAPIVGVLARGGVVLFLYPATLTLTGFFRTGELDRIRQIAARLRPPRATQVPVETTELAGEIVGTPSPEELLEQGRLATRAPEPHRALPSWQRAALAVSGIALLTYLATAGGSLASTDAVVSYELTESLVEHGSIALAGNIAGMDAARGKDGRYYSPFGIGQSLYNVPFYLAGVSVERLLGVRIGKPDTLPRAIVALGSAVAAAGCVWLIFLFAAHLTLDARAAALTALIAAFATLLWPYSKFGFSAPLATFWLLAGVYSAWRGAQAGSLRKLRRASWCLGAALLTRHELLVATVPIAAWVFWQARASVRDRITRVANVSAGVVIAGAIALAYNHARFGHPFDTGYLRDDSSRLGGSVLAGLSGLLLSPHASLFVYTPIAIIGVVALIDMFKRDRATAALFAATTVACLLLYASLSEWAGGRSYGPRYLVPLLPYVCLPLASWLTRDARPFRKRLVTAAAVISIAVQIPAVIVDFSKVRVEYARQIGPAAFAASSSTWSASGLWLNACAASRAVPRNVRYLAGLEAPPPLERTAAEAERDFSQQFSFSLDFWWLYLHYLGVIDRRMALVLGAVPLVMAAWLAVALGRNLLKRGSSRMPSRTLEVGRI